jgi:trigger factor
MTVTETLNEGLKRAYDLVVEARRITEKVDAAIADVAPKIRMPGFRPGKVPHNLVRKMHGPTLHREAINEAINEAVAALLAERGLRPAMQPKIDLKSDPAEGDVRFSVELEVLPQVPDVALEGIALEKLVVEPTDAELDIALQNLAQQQKSFADAPEGHEAAAGDEVVMDFAGTVDGVAFEGGTGTGMAVELGSGRLIPGFEDQLLGVRTGDDRVVRLDFPADYGAVELAGKAAEFAVTITAVRQPQIPAVDDALATSLGLESLEQLRAILKEQTEAELGRLSRTYLKRKLLDHLAAAQDFEVPPSMVEAEFAQIWAQAEREAGADGKEQLEAERDEYRRIAERRVRLGLLLADIGQKQAVTVTPQEMNQLVAREAARYRGQEDQVRRFFAENEAAAAQLRAPLFEDKVVDLLLGKADITERTVTREELEAAIADEDETPLATRGAHHGHVHGSDCDHDHDHDHDHHHHDGHDHGDDASDAAQTRKPAARRAKAAASDGEAAMDDAAGQPERKKRAKKTTAGE